MLQKKPYRTFYISMLVVLSIIAIRCTNSESKVQTAAANLTGEELAKKYCTSCHLYTSPELLDKKTWQQAVLPGMARALGIQYYSGEPYADPGYTSNGKEVKALPHTNVSVEEWNKIVSFYIKHSPDSVAGQARPPVHQVTNLFHVKRVLLPSGAYPSATFVKIDPGNHRIYAANGYDSSLDIYNTHGDLLSKNYLHNTVVDMYFDQPLGNSGVRSGIFTNIGIMNPNDLKTGSVEAFHISADGHFDKQEVLFDSLQRPVQAIRTDFNNDGLPDYLVCAFGNHEGMLYWMENKGNGKFEPNIIRPLPGAIKAYIDDINHDGLPDVIALMAQAEEGIYVFTNKGNGVFETSNVLLFPPVYGSSYFELTDFNKDGYMDILYTCGDNADYSANVLKPFHGVYIFLNDGKNNFTQKYFYPIHGCYKAMAADFDGDGDLDIAAISFFPDYRSQPRESFVYLQNKGDFQFDAYTIREYGEGHWLTMDAADADGDGDIDIVLGSLVPPVRNISKQFTNASARKTAVLLLENQTK